MKPFKSIMSMTLMFSAVMYVVVDFAFADDRDAMQMDTAPGPAYTTVDGKVTKIEGPVYTIQTESRGYQNYGTSKNVSETKIYVGRETKKSTETRKWGIRSEPRSHVTALPIPFSKVTLHVGTGCAGRFEA